MHHFSLLLLVAAATLSPDAGAVCRTNQTSDALGVLRDGQQVPRNLALVEPRSAFDDGPLEARSASDTVSFLVEHVDGLTIHRVERDLQPLTAYDVCAGSGRCVSVVTSEESDDAATEPVTASLTETHGLFRLDSECGGPTDTTVVVIEAERPPDAVTMVMRRRIGSDSELVEVQLLFNGEPTVGLVDHASEGGDAAYEVSTVDLAGNASEPTMVTADLGCAGSCSSGESGLPVFFVGLGLFRRARRRRRPDGQRGIAAG